MRRAGASTRPERRTWGRSVGRRRPSPAPSDDYQVVEQLLPLVLKKGGAPLD
jgi:hypothetical protein